jgi:phage host-nuclease inhibitor protein Gam
MKRIKLTKPALHTRGDVEHVMSDVRGLTIRKNKVLLDRERARKVIDENCEPVLSDIDRMLDEKAQLLEAWAEVNPGEFNGRKTLETIHGLLGWRIGQPQVKALNGWKTESILDALRELLPGYIRQKEERNNQLLIADRDAIGPDKLRLCGLKVVQEEPFFVEPKVEQTENRLTPNPDS